MQLDIRGWHYDRPIFKRLLEATRPETVIELGSWLGASVIHMATEAKKLGLKTQFYAVDFWGAHEIQGTVATYDQFCFNVKESGHGDCITPIRLRTLDAARQFHELGIRPQLVYVDADHTYEGCLGDIEAYYPLLTSGGVMFGDDYTEIKGVNKAVQEFCARYKLTHSADYYHWALPPKSSDPINPQSK